ncbi:hypothetical protein [Legionella sainthelensi]|uniref:hypothetical protein n=1 Tax=Legionella sainthelensi TaxID=28087 RepID=UPI0012DF6BD4|nr:hypothetical protein [Legionella sainthelensi]
MNHTLTACTAKILAAMSYFSKTGRKCGSLITGRIEFFNINPRIANLFPINN